MSKQSVKKVSKAKVVVDFGDFSKIIGDVIEFDSASEEPKHTIVRGVEMQQYNGTLVKTDGFLDESGTVLAVAIARPGRPNYSSSTNNSMSRTLMYGDVAVFGFNKAEKKLGMNIMPTKSWLIMQSRDAANGEKPPFVRTPWDARQTNTNTMSSLQPPTFNKDIKKLCDLAINYAATECRKKIENNEPSRIQESYTTALAESIRAAAILGERAGKTPQRRSVTQVQSGEDISSAAASLLL